MNNLKRFRLPCLACLLLVLLCPLRTHAAVTISIIDFTETNLSFELSGSIDVVGAYNGNILYIGEPGDEIGEAGNTSWVDAYSVGNWSDANEDVVGAFTPNAAIVNSFGAGDFAAVAGSVFPINGSTIQGIATVSGTFNPEVTDTSKWIVSVGHTNSEAEALPDLRTATGSVIPEPSSGLLALSLFALAGMRRRQQ